MKTKKDWLLLIVVNLTLAFLFLRNIKKIQVKKHFIALLKGIKMFPHKIMMLNMYTDCFTLPIANYIDIVSEKKFKRYKKIEWLPVTVSCYAEAIQKIYDHSIELSNNKKIKEIDNLSAKLSKLKEKAAVLTILQKVLQFKESEECLKWLRNNYYNAPNRNSALKSIENALKTITLNAELLKKDIEKNGSIKKDVKPTTKAAFIKEQQLLKEMHLSISEKGSAADYIITLGIVSDRVDKQQNTK